MKNLLTLIILLSALLVKAQDKPIVRNECGTKTPTKALIIAKEEMQKFLRSTSSYSVPFCVKVYFTIFADDNGSNRATTDADVLRQFQNMVNQFAPHGICFVLMGIRQINSSDYNVQDADDEEDELIDIKVINCLNVFIHAQFTQANLAGKAYGIYNTNAFLSLLGSEVTSTTNITLMAHEVGHVFGLYHTFERHPWDPLHGAESVARDGDCKDCDDDGDLLCDTPADPDDSDYYLRTNTNASCIYTGTKLDECSVPYTPAVNNIMSYGKDICINTFTAGQGNRMRYYVGVESGLQYILAHDFVVVEDPITISYGTDSPSARDQITIQPTSGQVLINGSAIEVFQSKKIVLKNGTRFAPGVGGKTHLKQNSYCN